MDVAEIIGSIFLGVLALAIIALLGVLVWSILSPASRRAEKALKELVKGNGFSEYYLGRHSTLAECPECGALVKRGATGAHKDWHEKSQIEVTR